MHFCEYVCHELEYFDCRWTLSWCTTRVSSLIKIGRNDRDQNSNKVVINTLVIMAFDRYCTVVRSKTANFLKRCKQKPSFILLVSVKQDYMRSTQVIWVQLRSIQVIILLWCAGILTSIPIIVRTKVSSVGNDSRNDYCGINWEGSRCSRALPSGENTSADVEIIKNGVLEEDVGCWSLGKCSFTQEEQMYRINLLIWTFCLPMIAIVICYWNVYRLVLTQPFHFWALCW